MRVFRLVISMNWTYWNPPSIYSVYSIGNWLEAKKASLLIVIFKLFNRGRLYYWKLVMFVLRSYRSSMLELLRFRMLTEEFTTDNLVSVGRFNIRVWTLKVFCITISDRSYDSKWWNAYISWANWDRDTARESTLSLVRCCQQWGYRQLYIQKGWFWKGYFEAPLLWSHPCYC